MDVRKGWLRSAGPKAELLPPSFRRAEPACFHPHRNWQPLPQVRCCLTFCGPGAATAAVEMIHRREGGREGKEPGQLSLSWRQGPGSVGEAGPRVPEFPAAPPSPDAPHTSLPSKTCSRSRSDQQVRFVAIINYRDCLRWSG